MTPAERTEPGAQGVFCPGIGSAFASMANLIVGSVPPARAGAPTSVLVTGRL
ncbi:hypothetical protein ACIREM_09790 [Streptomyces shenzhenensis]|uniref:hypothetical protein n=1 Tax=Streptomyces shenzhenensis TaxID=943815 RepID=UPI0037F2396B